MIGSEFMQFIGQTAVTMLVLAFFQTVAGFYILRRRKSIRWGLVALGASRLLAMWAIIALSFCGLLTVGQLIYEWVTI